MSNNWGSLANGVDSDQMPHSAACDLHVHLFARTYLSEYWGKYDMVMC